MGELDLIRFFSVLLMAVSYMRREEAVTDEHGVLYSFICRHKAIHFIDVPGNTPLHGTSVKSLMRKTPICFPVIMSAFLIPGGR